MKRFRVTKKLLIKLATDYANWYNRQYGNDAGNIGLADADGRCAPYNYLLVDYVKHGAGNTIYGPVTARQMYDFLRHR